MPRGSDLLFIPRRCLALAEAFPLAGSERLGLIRGAGDPLTVDFALACLPVSLRLQTQVAGFEVALMFGPFASHVVGDWVTLPTNSSA